MTKIKINVPRMSVQSLTKRKTVLAFTIRNIKSDYAKVAQEDMPEDVVVEIASLFAELITIRELLTEMETAQQDRHANEISYQ